MQMTLVKREMELANAKPFLKWAGGKTQLLPEFEKRLPSSVKKDKVIKSYIEPFIGGGAMFFFLKRNYHVKKSFLFDINPELIIGYKTIQNNSKELIKILNRMEKEYLKKSEKCRKEFYYKVRDSYNLQINGFDYSNYNSEWIKRTSYLIFLNKTCFNGLFRQNKKGEFNVPFGRYKNPTICDQKNISQVSIALKNAKIFCADFNESDQYINEDSFVYLDPPYRPLNKTSNFTSYAKDGFDDEDQRRLSSFFEKMDRRGAHLMLSNSDPKNEDPDDEFFDTLYSEYNIERVPAKRHINCDASKRGEIKELIIRNY
ncbi:MAG: DNA adenine methylase [Methanobacteriaceae archaeon]|nr:DNA adenine methylase [Methanobacteriaceae archaeon]